MLISKHIHVNKQILFFLPSYYIKSLVRQLTAQTTIFFLSISVRFFAEEKDKKPIQNQYKQNYRENETKLGTDPPIGIGTNDINAYILFVYFCIILKQGKKRTDLER